LRDAEAGHPAEAKESRFRHMVENTILTVQLIVEFAKRVPEFNTISAEDKVILLRVSYFEKSNLENGVETRILNS
jgi:hypothetical protein